MTNLRCKLYCKRKEIKVEKIKLLTRKWCTEKEMWHEKKKILWRKEKRKIERQLKLVFMFFLFYMASHILNMFNTSLKPLSTKRAKISVLCSCSCFFPWNLRSYFCGGYVSLCLLFWSNFASLIVLPNLALFIFIVMLCLDFIDNIYYFIFLISSFLILSTFLVSFTIFISIACILAPDLSVDI